MNARRVELARNQLMTFYDEGDPVEKISIQMANRAISHGFLDDDWDEDDDSIVASYELEICFAGRETVTVEFQRGLSPKIAVALFARSSRCLKDRAAMRLPIWAPGTTSFQTPSDWPTAKSISTTGGSNFATIAKRSRSLPRRASMGTPLSTSRDLWGHIAGPLIRSPSSMSHTPSLDHLQPLAPPP